MQKSFFHNVNNILLNQGFAGRRASFEVKVNGKLIFSKLSTKALPDPQEIVNVVEVFIWS